jgi:hypothetical protein
MNKFRNEMNIKLGSQEILLRPTFENVASMESNVGGLAFLAWKFSKGARAGNTMSENIQGMPSMTECAQIIFYNQAAVNQDDPTKKKLNLEEIWELVQEEGLYSVVTSMTIYLAKITSGQKKVDELEAKKTESAEEKKT